LVTASPSISIRPAEGRSNPETSDSSVLLPQPDDPTMATNSPGLTSSETLDSARVSRSGEK
jgi:hypothetical protein